MMFFFEKKYNPYELDLDKVYELFKNSYLKSTGKSWDYDKFMRRAKMYIFYGDENGYVMVRPQRSGLYKLVGSAGNQFSIAKGLRELQNEKVPIWGAVSKELLKPIKRLGFIDLPGFVVVKLFELFDLSMVFGGKVKVASDGAIIINYEDLGEAKKYYVANKEYYEWLLKNYSDMIPEEFIPLLKNIINFGSAASFIQSFF